MYLKVVPLFANFWELFIRAKQTSLVADDARAIRSRRQENGVTRDASFQGQLLKCLYDLNHGRRVWDVCTNLKHDCGRSFVRKGVITPA